MMSASLTRKAFRFALVGGLSTLLSYGAFLVFLVVLPYQLANVVAWALTLAFGFGINRRFTWGLTDSAGMGRQAILYGGSSLAFLAQSSIGLWVMVGCFRVQPWIAALVNTAISACANFLFQNTVTFGSRPRTNPLA